MKLAYFFSTHAVHKIIVAIIFILVALFSTSCKAYICPTYTKADSQKFKGENKTADIYEKYHQKKPRFK